MRKITLEVLGIAALALLVFLGILHRKFLITVILLSVSAVVQYITHRSEVKFNIGISFFLALILARIDGVLIAAAVIFLADFMPKFIVGDFDEVMIISTPTLIIFCFLSFLLQFLDIWIAGILISILAYGIIFFISSQIDVPVSDQLTEIGLPLVVNLLLFLTFSVPLLSLLRMITI